MQRKHCGRSAQKQQRASALTHAACVSAIRLAPKRRCYHPARTATLPSIGQIPRATYQPSNANLQNASEQSTNTLRGRAPPTDISPFWRRQVAPRPSQLQFNCMRMLDMRLFSRPGTQPAFAAEVNRHDDLLETLLKERQANALKYLDHISAIRLKPFARHLSCVLSSSCVLRLRRSICSNAYGRGHFRASRMALM